MVHVHWMIHKSNGVKVSDGLLDNIKTCTFGQSAVTVCNVFRLFKRQWLNWFEVRDGQKFQNKQIQKQKNWNTKPDLYFVVLSGYSNIPHVIKVTSRSCLHVYEFWMHKYQKHLTVSRSHRRLHNLTCESLNDHASHGIYK